MSVELPTEQHFEILSLKGGCAGSSESTLVEMPHCWSSHVMAQIRKLISNCTLLSGGLPFYFSLLVSTGLKQTGICSGAYSHTLTLAVMVKELAKISIRYLQVEICHRSRYTKFLSVKL